MPDPQKARWVYPAQRTTMSKEAEKPFLTPGLSHALVGFDGQVAGGKRPFPGFRRIHEFNKFRETAPFNGSGTNTRVIDAFVVNFLVGSEDYGVAVVYRVAKPDTVDGTATLPRSLVFVDYWLSSTKKWVLGTSLGFVSGDAEDVVVGDLDPRCNGRRVDGLADANTGRTFGASDGRTMDVAVVGQFVFVFLQNTQPVMFYVDEGVFTVQTDTGPNRRPTIVDPEKAGGMGSLRTTGAADRDGAAQVHLLEFYPSEVGLGLTQTDGSVVSLLAGGYSFAFRLRDSVTGRISALSEVATSLYHDFDPLYYAGSNSGSGSGFTGGSGLASGTAVQSLLAAIEICYNPTKYDQAYLYRSVQVEGAGGTFTSKILFLEKIIDLADYATVNSPLPTESGVARSQSVYYYTFTDKAIVQKEKYQDREIFDEEIPYAGTAQAYEGALVVSNLRTSPAISSDENTVFDPAVGLGEIRWSSLYELSPELFPVYNRFVPSLPSDDVISFNLIGPHCLGYSASRQYMLRREGGSMRVEPLHEGYGLVNYMAADTVGSMAYGVTNKGVKMTSSNGQMDDVKFLDHLIINDWRGDDLAISAAFDPASAAFYVLNSADEHAAILWFNTALVTELYDLPFEAVGRGVWFSKFHYNRAHLTGTGSGIDNADYLNPLEERAFFIYNPVLDGNATDDKLDYPGLYVADYERYRVQTNGLGWGSGYTQGTLLDLEGDAIFKVSLHTTIGQALLLASGRYVPAQLSGAYVYVLKSDVVPPGTKGQIKRTLTTGDGGSVRLTSDGNTALQVAGTGLQAGDLIGISPVYQEWTAWPLGVQAVDGEPYAAPDDFFWLRHADAMGAFFTDVGGTTASETGDFLSTPSYEAILYVGSSDVPADTALVYDSDDGTRAVSIVANEAVRYAAFGATDDDALLEGKHGFQATCLTPGVRIYCPNIDYRLIGFLVVGSVRPGVRSSFPD